MKRERRQHYLNKDCFFSYRNFVIMKINNSINNSSNQVIKTPILFLCVYVGYSRYLKEIGIEQN